VSQESCTHHFFEETRTFVFPVFILEEVGLVVVVEEFVEVLVPIFVLVFNGDDCNVCVVVGVEVLFETVGVLQVVGAFIFDTELVGWFWEVGFVFDITFTIEVVHPVLVIVFVFRTPEDEEVVVTHHGVVCHEVFVVDQVFVGITWEVQEFVHGDGVVLPVLVLLVLLLVEVVVHGEGIEVEPVFVDHWIDEELVPVLVLFVVFVGFVWVVVHDEVVEGFCCVVPVEVADVVGQGVVWVPVVHDGVLHVEVLPCPLPELVVVQLHEERTVEPVFVGVGGISTTGFTIGYIEKSSVSWGGVGKFTVTSL
jgi:hypothetical protein